MRNAIVVGIVLLVTGINAWMTWDLWRDNQRPPTPRALPATGEETPKPAIRAHKIFRPQRQHTSEARPPWLNLESDDYHEYAANLRAIGCPENTIRDIIVADIGKTFAEQQRILNDRSTTPFWLTADQREELDLERQRKLRELALAKWELLRELFVHPVDEEVMKVLRGEGMAQASLWVVAGFLERDQLVQLFGLVGYYAHQIKMLEQASLGILIAEDYDNARALRDRMEKEITALVGTSSVEEMYLRGLLSEGEEAGILQYGVNLSGTEFRNLMKIKAAAADVYTRLFAEAGFEDMMAEQVSEQQIETALAQYLGTEKYEDYTRAKDDRFQDIYAFATGKGLSKKEAVAVFNARDRAETELERIEADKSLNAEEQVLLQAAIKTRLESDIRRHFGNNIAREYREDGVGEWVDELIKAPEPAEEK